MKIDTNKDSIPRWRFWGYCVVNAICIACTAGKFANYAGAPDCYEQERVVPDNKDITATISVIAAMVVLVSVLSFTYYHRATIFGNSSDNEENDIEEVVKTKSESTELTAANRA